MLTDAVLALGRKLDDCAACRFLVHTAHELFILSIHARRLLYRAVYYDIHDIDAYGLEPAHKMFTILADCTDELHTPASLSDSRRLIRTFATRTPLKVCGRERFSRANNGWD